MKAGLSFATAALFLAALPFAALAQNNAVQKEVTTARAHAMMAAGADSLKMTHTHLHHVINCLVGPDGQAYDSTKANPCDGMGSGALPDSANQSSLHGALQQALSNAKEGVNDTNMKSAQQSAHKVAQELERAAPNAAGG